MPLSVKPNQYFLLNQQLLTAGDPDEQLQAVVGITSKLHDRIGQSQTQHKLSSIMAC
jgi:hypothetical protein